jgi:serine/threonine protein kinase
MEAKYKFHPVFPMFQKILFHLQQQAMFSEGLAKFYAAEVVLALEHLHNMDIIHREYVMQKGLFTL